ncbi:MAG: beta-ketoacyl-ACP synthase [Pseudopedobacter saltans]|uniref:3-oxoacyl-[acyl-carrier-protein] synthase 1 n=1 Tax=Pseudopedobacter saltans TaxID=151895 RepID=A0A2W5FDV3_9SPHI|nr:MAG: beta-ketoacyl-ACP synthase [Pseudopedobacter saltans]
MGNRVVITGMGVVAPNGVGLSSFNKALMEGKSGIAFQQVLADWNLGCQVGGIPPVTKEEGDAFAKQYNIVKLRSPGILYGLMAGVEAWLDAGLPLSHRKDSFPDWDSGCIFGTSVSGVDAFAYNVALAREGNVRKIGGRIAQQAMNSGISAYLGGILGLGNQVTTNSSEGNTGSESIAECFYRIQSGQAKRMIAGGTESSSPYVFQAYDSTIIPDTKAYLLLQEKGKYSKSPEKAFTPISMKNKGVVIGSGSGALVLESLASAKRRKARIYAEILSANISCGGALGKYGGIERSNIDVFFKALHIGFKEAKTDPSEITYVNSTFQNYCDNREVHYLTKLLGLTGKYFPYFNSTKSMIGHCLSASGSLETIATVLQMYHSYIHPSINGTPLHPDIAGLVSSDKVPTKAVKGINIEKALKTTMALGDVCSGMILKKWNDG